MARHNLDMTSEAAVASCSPTQKKCPPIFLSLFILDISKLSARLSVFLSPHFIHVFLETQYEKALLFFFAMTHASPLVQPVAFTSHNRLNEDHQVLSVIKV